MVVTLRERLKQFCNDKYMKILLGIKLISTFGFFTGLLFLFNRLVIGTSIYSTLYMLVWGMSTEMEGVSAIIFKLVWFAIPILWVIFYCIFFFFKKKWKITYIFFIAANVLDGLFAIRSLSMTFSIAALIGVLYSFTIVGLLLILCKKNNKGLHESLSDMQAVKEENINLMQ